MTALSLLATLTFMPGLEFFEPMDLWVEDGVVAYETTIGTGQAILPGRGAKLDFELTDGLGRLIQSSEQRGQQFSYVPGGGDPLLDTATNGMVEGTERVVWFGPQRLPASFANQTELLLRVRASR